MIAAILALSAVEGLVLLAQELREVLLSDRPVELRVAVSTAAESRATVVTFPEDSLEAIVAAWNEADLSVERRRENLFLKLLKPVQGDLHVTGASGTLYRLAIRPAEGAWDGRVKIVLPKDRGRGLPEPLELVRTMRLARRPAEGTVLRADEVVHVSAELRGRLAFVYDGESYRGYVIRVENLTTEPARLDPSRFTGKDLVLAAAREMLLPPGGKTVLYLVFWKKP